MHGAETLGLAAPAETLHHAAEAVGRSLGAFAGIASWVTTAIGSGIVGLIVGGIIAFIAHAIGKARAS
jgi:predicted DNA repair protein MutK